MKCASVGAVPYLPSIYVAMIIRNFTSMAVKPLQPTVVERITLLLLSFPMHLEPCSVNARAQTDRTAPTGFPSSRPDVLV